MANFPLANGIAGALTVADKKQALENFLAAAKQLPGGAAETVLVIAAGVITPTRAAHAVDTEGAAAADDLTHIALDHLPDGSLIELRCQDPSRVVTVRHQAGGVGQIVLAGGADFVLDNLDKFIRLQRRGTEWRERGRYVDIGDFAAAVHGHQIDDVIGLEDALYSRPTDGEVEVLIGAQIAPLLPRFPRQQKFIPRTTTPSTTSTSYVSTGITFALDNALASTASRVRIHVLGYAGAGTGGNGGRMELTLFDGAVALHGALACLAPVALVAGSDAAMTRNMFPFHVVFEHVPGDTMPKTYDIRWRLNSNTFTGYLNRNGDNDRSTHTVIIIEEYE